MLAGQDSRQGCIDYTFNIGSFNFIIGRVMLIFEDIIFPLWNHLFLCYPCHADIKTGLVFKVGSVLVVDVKF